jgi:hypothetical protein
LEQKAQRVVIVEVLIAQSDREHPLTQQRPDLMLDQIQTANITKAFRKSPNQTDRPVSGTEQKPPASEVIAPPSNPATTARRSTGANANNSALHSVWIGVRSVLR